MHDVANGNLDAMSHLFERYHKRLFNFFFQIKSDRAVCEDMTQTAFYKAMRYRTSYKGGQFVLWIFKIARNVFSDHYQKSKRTLNNVDIDLVTHKNEDNKIDKTQDVQHLHNALNRLNIEEKQLIIMNRLQGIKYDRIAEIIGSSEGAVKVKAHPIIKKIKTVYFETI